jgi:sugar phosphate isomerase/epimerase
MLLGTQDKDFFPSELTEKFRFIHKCGFDCFEIDGSLILDHFDEIKTAQKNTNLNIVSVCGGYRGWIADFIEERRRFAVDDISKILRKLPDIGAQGIVVPAAWGMFTYRLPPMVSPRSKEGDNDAIHASLRILDQVAKDAGVLIFLEPLNRYQDHMLNLISDAARIIDEGSYKAVKITSDFYHMSIEEDDISNTLEKYQEYLGHVHIAENHRYQPGTGSIDFKRHLKTLQRIGYTGPLVNEGRIRGEKPLEAYLKSVEYLKSILKEIGKES